MPSYVNQTAKDKTPKMIAPIATAIAAAKGTISPVQPLIQTPYTAERTTATTLAILIQNITGRPQINIPQLH
jgi:hypothetical protein